MIYCPHTLQIKSTTSSTDEFGKPIVGTDVWTTLCPCRCDDNSTKEFHSDNGGVYRPGYHVVCNGYLTVKADAEIRCLDNQGNVRGSGKVYMVKNLNFLNYSELWM
jgi:hypothetical protein